MPLYNRSGSLIGFRVRMFVARILYRLLEYIAKYMNDKQDAPKAIDAEVPEDSIPHPFTVSNAAIYYDYRSGQVIYQIIDNTPN